MASVELALPASPLAAEHADKEGTVDGEERLREMLQAARVPLSYAGALATAAVDEGVRSSSLGIGCDRATLELITRRAAMPVGHRMRLLNRAN